MLLGRIYCTGTPQDYAKVHALQDQFKLQPLSTCGKDYTPPPGKVDPSIDMKMAVRDQVNRLSATEYFTLLADLMKRNPPAPADAPALKRFERIGLVAGQSFDPKALDSHWDKRLPQLSYDRIMLHFLGRDGDITRQNGWAFTTKAGVYGTNYKTAIGLGANRPQDAIYPTSMPLDGNEIASCGWLKLPDAQPDGVAVPARGPTGLTAGQRSSGNCAGRA